MKCVERSFGVSTADAEGVKLRFERDTLTLSFVDWQENGREIAFSEVLAFRWQEFDEDSIRDDTTYEVIDSEWLARQAGLQAVPAESHAHYKLCFNACGVLDVLCRRLELEVVGAGEA